MAIELLHIDCMDYMATLPDMAFDLAIVDPPYGININFNMGRRKMKKKIHCDNNNWDKSTPQKEYFIELKRVSTNQIIWGGNYFNLPPTSSWIFWDKHTPRGVSFADGELAWTSFGGTLRKISLPYSGFIGREAVRIHPTQKPVALYKILMKTYLNGGGVILDTHLGSGSSAIAAHQMGFDFVGCEIDKDYYDAACKRFKEQTMQQDLFKQQSI